MKRLLITCKAHPGEPEWFAVWQLSRDRFAHYAAVHGYEFREVWYDDFANDPRWREAFHGRLPVWPFNPSMTSPCWLKIPAINVALEQGYDEVLYIDNDCVVLDHSKDIATEVPEGKLLAMHNSVTPEGTGPNIGVVYTRNAPITRRFWRKAWEIDAWKIAKWSDNGQVMDLLGYSVAPPLRKLWNTDYTPIYHVLGNEWCGFGSGMEPGAVPSNCRIFHAAWGRDGAWKLSVMKNAILQKE